MWWMPLLWKVVIRWRISATINAELESYNPELLKRPQVIAANKTDAIYAGEEIDPIERLREEFEPEGIKVFPISAVTGKGVKELLYHVNELLKTVDRKPVIFEKEFEYQFQAENLPYTVEHPEDGVFVVEGPRDRQDARLHQPGFGEGLRVLPEILKGQWYSTGA